MEEIKSIFKEISGKIKRIRLLVLDVDGVMTDGSLIYNDDGTESKVFDVKDGHGLRLLMAGGIEVAIISGRKSDSVTKRAKDLGIKLAFQGIKHKLPLLNQMLKEKEISLKEVAYMGDDLIDIPVMKAVGLSIAVSDAHPDVKSIADIVTAKPGGRGAVREVCELILKEQGLWEKLMKTYY